MFEDIIRLIKQYDKIIIHRHKNPDGDAYGSQLGLKEVIRLNFPEKKVYAVGDMNSFAFLGDMDVVNDEDYKDALAIILDVAVSQLVSDDRYLLADHVLVIDHHLNDSNIEGTVHIDSSHIATCQLVADLVYTFNLKIGANAATSLLTGIVTDSGRFLYPNTSEKTFELAAFLTKNGANRQFVYDNLYTETLNFKKLKGHFINNFKTTKHNVAYMKNTTQVAKEFNVSTFVVSRAMVNQMSGIDGVEIWANFTEDEEGSIQCELRSKKVPIVDIAKKYGGGGHLLACGCTLASFDETDLVLQDLDQLLEKRI